jgi:hypothetical protein
MAHIPYEATIAGTQAPPPYECTGVKVFAFPLLADPRRSRRCDQFLNIAPSAAGITFEPIPSGPEHLYRHDRGASTTVAQSADSAMECSGETPQRELLFSFPVGGNREACRLKTESSSPISSSTTRLLRSPGARWSDSQDAGGFQSRPKLSGVHADQMRFQERRARPADPDGRSREEFRRIGCPPPGVPTLRNDVDVRFLDADPD